MKVTLTKHGGLAATVQRPPLVVDTDTLPKAAEEELKRLAANAKSAPHAEEEGQGRARDAMSYTIAVDDGRGPTVFRQSDANMSPAFAALLDWLERHTAHK